jgi:hypothetical protein
MKIEKAEDFNAVTTAPLKIAAMVKDPRTRDSGIRKIMNMMEAADTGNTVVPTGQPPEQVMNSWMSQHGGSEMDAMNWMRDNSLPVTEEEWHKVNEEGNYFPDSDPDFRPPMSQEGKLILDSDVYLMTADERARYQNNMEREV